MANYNGKKNSVEKEEQLDAAKVIYINRRKKR